MTAGMNTSRILSRCGRLVVSGMSVAVTTIGLLITTSCGNTGVQPGIRVEPVAAIPEVPQLSYSPPQGLLGVLGPTPTAVPPVPTPSPSPDLPYGLDEERSEYGSNQLLRSWESCGHLLLGRSGQTGQSSRRLTSLYRKHSVSKDEVFLRYVMAVMYVESRFNREAVSDKEAYGLMQMTRPAVRDAQKSCRLHVVGDMAELLDSATNVRYGSCYLRKLLRETDGDWTRALVIFNGGYRQLDRLERNGTLVKETSDYIRQVHEALRICNASDNN